MPNWKKVIVSGSSAALTSVTATAGFTGSLLGTASYATQALSASFASTASLVNVISTINDTDYYLVGVDSSNGTMVPEQLYTAGPTFNPDAGVLYVPGEIVATSAIDAPDFIGNLSGNAQTATTASFAATATNAANVAITSQDTTPIAYNIVFTGGTSGNHSLNVDATTLTYNPNTTTLTTGKFSGALTGTASYATAASQSGYTMQFVLATTGSNPAASTTYRMGAPVRNQLQTVGGRTRIYVPRPGKVKYAHVYARTNGQLASAGTSSLFLTKNNSVAPGSSETIGTSTTVGSVADATIVSTAISMSVVQGDFLEINFTTPAWGTLPTAVEANAIIYIENNLT